MKFGEYLKEVRIKRELSINQLALYSAVSAAHISRIERGLREASPDILKKLSNILRVPYEELMQAAGYLECSKESNDIYLFDKETFRRLLIKARGDRNNKEFAESANVSRSYVSGYINMSIDSPPTPDVIKRLSTKAQNNVRYEDLMEAAGYISSTYIEEEKQYYASHNDPEDKKLLDEIKKLPPEAQAELDQYIEFLKHKHQKKD